MNYAEHVLAVGNEAMDRLLQLLLCEATEAVGAPVELYSIRQGVMKKDPEGQWVDRKRLEATLALLQVARMRIDAVWRASLELPKAAETPEMVDAVHRAREFFRQTRVAEEKGAKRT